MSTDLTESRDLQPSIVHDCDRVSILGFLHLLHTTSHTILIHEPMSLLSHHRAFHSRSSGLSLTSARSYIQDLRTERVTLYPYIAGCFTRCPAAEAKLSRHAWLHPLNQAFKAA